MIGVAYRHQFNPWDVVFERLAEWHVLHAFLPTSLGETDSDAKTITLHCELDQVGRRTTLAHELAHAFRGDSGCCPQAVESRIDRCVARLLMPIGFLGDVLVWATCLEEAADELWVDVPMLQVRLRSLSAAERDELTERLADMQIP